jgi:hypothetical protein
VPDDPCGALRAQNEAQGLGLTPRSLKPLWIGERLDLGWAIGVFHPLARRRPAEGSGTSRDGNGRGRSRPDAPTKLDDVHRSGDETRFTNPAASPEQEPPK